MQKYVQKDRPLQVSTPLTEDVLLVTGFHGTEQLNHLFSFEITLVAHNSATIDFSQLVGNDITIKVSTPGAESASDWGYITGIYASFSQGDRNEEFASYYAEIVPRVWLLTRRFRSRIFQQKSVLEILKEVLHGFPCDFQLRAQYERREYCVQYRESDFDFVSRLMGGLPESEHVFEWRKTQAVRATKYSLRDHSFQQPTQTLEAKVSILDSIRAGTVTHQLKGQANEPLASPSSSDSFGTSRRKYNLTSKNPKQKQFSLNRPA
jgi:type VI secretion system secreted protein VgrG